MTSHTCDSHRTGSRIVVVPAETTRTGHGATILTRRTDDDSGPMPRYGRTVTGRIPQVSQTWGHLAPAYAAMNEFQVAIGESTFGGRPSLQSDQGLIDCETLDAADAGTCEVRSGGDPVGGTTDRASTAGATPAKPSRSRTREKSGSWRSSVPDQERVGAVWAAQRIPDDHVSVVANASRIGPIDLMTADQFLASRNVMRARGGRRLLGPRQPDRFASTKRTTPTGRTSLPATRREWRVLSLLAPSLQLDRNRDVFPLSVKPDEPVGPERIMALFRDTYEGTDFDMVKELTVTDEQGQSVKSPLANPFMPYEMNRLLTDQRRLGLARGADTGPLVLHVRHGDTVTRLVTGPCGWRSCGWAMEIRP